MSGLSFFDALGVRWVDRKPLIIAELAGKPLNSTANFQVTELACKQIAAAAATFKDSSPPG
jgi:hypothetical protein